MGSRVQTIQRWQADSRAKVCSTRSPMFDMARRWMRRREPAWSAVARDEGSGAEAENRKGEEGKKARDIKDISLVLSPNEREMNILLNAVSLSEFDNNKNVHQQINVQIGKARSLACLLICVWNG